MLNAFLQKYRTNDEHIHMVGKITIIPKIENNTMEKIGTKARI